MSISKLEISISAALFFAAAAAQAATSMSVTNIAPATGVIESYDVPGNNSMGPRRTLANVLPDRTSGQLFTIATDTSVTFDAVTMRAANPIAFTNDANPHTFLLALMKDVDGDGKTETQIGSTYSFDMGGLNLAAGGDYITFGFGESISNLVSGVYSFETYFGEDDDANSIVFKRQKDTGAYAGGGQIGTSLPPTFPNPGLTTSTSVTNDFVFFIHGEMLATTPQSIFVSGSAPTNKVLESYDSALNNSLGPRRTVTKDNPDRTFGQTFTIDTDTAIDIEALTLYTKRQINFSGDSSNHTFQIAFLKDVNGDGKAEKQIGSTYVYDMTEQSVAANNRYITFNLGTPISNLTAGVYSFELYFGEDNDGNDLLFERSTTGNYYPRGGQMSKTDPTVFPNLNLGTNAASDVTFFIAGSESTTMPVVFTESAAVPTNNILKSYQAIASLASFSPTRQAEPTTTNNQNQVLGQSFTLDHSGSATLSSLTMRHRTGGNKNFNADPHTFWIALLADTTGNGKGDTTIGGTYAYDFTSESFAGGDYVTFHFGEGISGVTAGTYQVEFYWAEIDPESKSFAMERSTDGNHYAGGGQLGKFAHDGTFPVLDMGNVNANADFTFYVHGTLDVLSDPYDAWATGFPGFIDTDLDSDPEGDGLNNLMEYALNGDPTDNDSATVKPTVNTDGSWFVHVHTERVGDATLNYAVELDQNADLPTASWATNGIEWVADSATAGDYKSVTNRTDNTDSQEFIRLQVEKN